MNEHMHKFFGRNKQEGFTLVELLIVIAIIAILAVVVFVALDPLKRFQDARNSTRWSDITAIMDAIKLNQVDNGGSFLSTIPQDGKNYLIGTPSGTDCVAGSVTDTCGAANITPDVSKCVDLAGLVTSGHLAAVPKDPSSGKTDNTDYYISVTSLGGVTVGACDPEGTTPPVIKITR